MNHSNQNTLRIIYLEDKPQDCELVAASLAAANLACEIIQARTKEQFEAALVRPDFDLILCDYTLPLYSGTEALAAAARLQPEIPFIFVSGTIGEERAVESLRMGATDYVLKDHLERLVPVVHRALREVASRRAERRAQEQLKATERRLDHLLAQCPAVTYSLRPQGGWRVFTWISSNLQQLLGFSAAEACAPEWWSNQVHPQDATALAVALPRLLAEKHISHDFRIRHKNGEYRWVREEQRLVSDASGRPVEILGSWLDNTERKGLEELLRQAQKMEAIGQLAGGVAHDFNNLLAVMGGNIELLLMDEDQHSKETKTVLKLVLGAIQRAANLTRQLLAFSRKHVMQAQRFNLNDTILNLAKMLKRLIGENIQLHCDPAPGAMFLHGDVAMIEQVLMNLVVNARDAMPHGGKLGIATERVTLDPAFARRHPDARLGEFVLLSVSDTGTGIAPEHLPHVFEPFFTTKKFGKGTGLGLAIVYGVVKQHEGWIEVTSQPGGGTRFDIFLPAAPAPVPAASAPEAKAGLRRGTERVLLVEDDYAVRALVQRVLETCGYRVWNATSADEALEIWRAHASEVKLLLTDILMPGSLTGWELAERLYQEKPGLKVIFMSGYSSGLAGANGDFISRVNGCFLQKPCPSWTILETVRRRLDEDATPKAREK